MNDSILAPTLSPLLEGGGQSVRAAFDRLVAAGFRAVQLSALQPTMRPRELDRDARRDLMATLNRRELAVSGLDCWIRPADFSDPQKVDRAVHAVKGAIELAADLRRIPVSLMLPDAQEPCQSIIDHAQHLGIELADHRVPLVEVEGLGVGMDPAAWLSHGADPVKAVLSTGERLVAARLCDLSQGGMRVPIGEPGGGRLDVTGYRIALSVSRYQRPIVVDARQWPDPWTGIERTAHRWQRAIR